MMYNVRERCIVSEIIMEIVPSAHGVKITLSQPDLNELDITSVQMREKSTGARRALWQILDRVKAETGFDAAAFGIEISMFEDKGGGCELFVRKAAAGRGGNLGYVRENYRFAPEKTEKQSAVCYRFDGLEMMAGACRQLAARGFSGESGVYYDDGGKYYLIVGGDEPTSSRLVRKYSFLSEFGDKCDAPCADSYIKEHCGCIAESDGVKIIAENC